MTSTDVDLFPLGELEPAMARMLAAQWRESQRLAMTAVIPKTITHRREKVNGTWQDVPQPPDVVKATVFAVVRYGSFFGFEPAISLGKIDVIEGRLEARYDALAGVMMDAGHQVRIAKATGDEVVLRVRRAEDRNDPDGWQEVSFSATEALAAGYIKKNPEDRDLRGAWYTRRVDMLMSKAIKRAFRWVTPDALVSRDHEHLIEGATVEQLPPPTSDPELTERAADLDDEPVDAELVDEPPAPPTDRERRDELQRQLMATATKAFPKKDGLLPAEQKARQTAQRHAVTYVALREFKSANDMNEEELGLVLTRLNDIEQGRLRIEERDGQWVAVQGDRELPIPPETADEAAA